MKRSAFVPSRVEVLESRIALSHIEVAHAIAIPRAAVAQVQSLELSGFAIGSDTTVGRIHLLRATGASISPLGVVSLAGFLVIPHAHGANRSVHGMVTLSNSQGTVAVSLRGTVTVYQGPFTFASGDLIYKIIRGTGAFRGASGSGPVLYGPGPAVVPGRFLLDFGNAPPPP
jgi:hypothetical protein